MLIDFESDETDASWSSWGGAGFQKIENCDREESVEFVDLVKRFSTSIYHYLVAKFGVDTYEKGPFEVWILWKRKWGSR